MVHCTRSNSPQNTNIPALHIAHKLTPSQKRKRRRQQRRHWRHESSSRDVTVDVSGAGNDVNDNHFSSSININTITNHRMS